MEIVLVRHGKPSAAVYPKLSAAGFVAWVRKYHHSGLLVDSLPPQQLKSQLESHYVVGSDLKRAVESAIRCTDQPPKTYKLLREMEIPRYKLPFTIKANYWLYLNRLLWTIGLKGPFESYSEAKQRACLAAELVICLAEEHQKVAVFGHGYLQFFMRKQLVKRGWKLQASSSSHWGLSRLTAPNDARANHQ
ncbi:histidine phosphatase family protein [Agarivorans sp. QJM3NY_33]|uniref:histidine phosphatase family protein n=1 Tax=Agarivorans sp. QJM3NY_33 TaxID=3421432 RepID=UPI003D7E5073